MSEYRDDAILTETLERIRRAELATVVHLPGTPEHARAVARLDRATRQMRRLADGHPVPPDGSAADAAPDRRATTTEATQGA